MIGLALALLLAGADAGPPPGARWLGPRPPARPARVATLAPSLTEVVLALGEGGRLVGVSRYDDDPAVKDLPRLGGVLDPSPEAVLARKPDLLLVNPNPSSAEVVGRLAALGVPVLEVELGTLPQVEAAERAVAAALGVPERGEALAAALHARIEAVRARAAGRRRVRALLVYGWQPLVVAGPGSFGDELLVAAGGENAAGAAKSAYAAWSVESAAAARPEVIIDATFNEAPPPVLASLPGLREARRVKPRSFALMHPGPRLGEALEELEGALHPAALDGRAR